MTLLLCFIAGAFLLTRSFRRIVEYRLDAPLIVARMTEDRERARVALDGLRRADALLDAWESSPPGGPAATRPTAEEAGDRIDADLAAHLAEADRAADAVMAGLPARQRARPFVLAADVAFAVVGAVLMAVSPILGVATIL